MFCNRPTSTTLQNSIARIARLSAIAELVVNYRHRNFVWNKLWPPQYAPAPADPVTLTFDLLTLKSVWESYVTWGTPVQSFVFLGLLVFELEPMYATSDGRRTLITA